MSKAMFIKFLIIFFVCFLKFVSCDHHEGDADDNAVEMVTIEPRIVGGYRPNYATLTKYVVSVRQRGETANKFGYTHFCAASIIAANKILTAAHCVHRNGKKSSSSAYKVVAKTPVRLNRSTQTQEINIKKVITHSQYSNSTLFHDIALLILEKDIMLDSKFAAKISLPKQNFQAGKLCTVVGWGKLYMHGPLANEILYVDLHLHSRKYCRRKFPNFSGKKICASNIYDKEKDACVGDSGGPLICNGIVSYGYGCAAGHAGIYTNVFKYVDWIKKSGQQKLKPVSLMLLMSCIFVSIF